MFVFEFFSVVQQLFVTITSKNTLNKMFSCLSSTSSLRFYLMYFQLLGQCPVVFNHSKQMSAKLLIAISFFHISVTTLLVIVVYVYCEYIFFMDHGFGQFNDMFLYTLILLAYYSIIIESYLKRQTQSKIWNLLAQFIQTDRLDEADNCKLWNSNEYNIYFIGSYISEKNSVRTNCLID